MNVDVTSPGATLALGMMFFDTSNRFLHQLSTPWAGVIINPSVEL